MHSYDRCCRCEACIKFEINLHDAIEKEKELLLRRKFKMKEIMENYQNVTGGSNISLETVWYFTFDNDTSDTEWMDVIRVALGKEPLSTGMKLDNSVRKSKAPTHGVVITRERVNGIMGFAAHLQNGSKIWDEDFCNLQEKIGIDYMDD